MATASERYYLKNRERLLLERREWAREYRAAHPEKAAEYRARTVVERRAADLERYYRRKAARGPASSGAESSGVASSPPGWQGAESSGAESSGGESSGSGSE
jgi:hypothetical protein